MQRAVVRAPLMFLVVVGVVLEGVLLYLAWPLAVLTGIAGGALFTVVVGLRMQREWDAPLLAARAAEPTEAAADDPAPETAAA